MRRAGAPPPPNGATVGAKQGTGGQVDVKRASTVEEDLKYYDPVTSVGIFFLYPPIGAQRVNMGRELYLTSAVFKSAMDECDAIATPLLPQPLVQVLYPDAVDEPMYRDVINQVEFAMPCLFAVEYALTALWISEGCRPHYVIGHSLGEFVAAVTANLISLEVALSIVCERARLMSELGSKGSMMAVRAPREVVAAAIDRVPSPLREQAALASANSPESVVISGSWVALRAALRELPPGTKTQRVLASHPDHSPLMEPICGPLAAYAKRRYASCPPPLHTEGQPTFFRFASTVTGGVARADAVADPEYWAAHFRGTVEFEAGLRALLAEHAARADAPNSQYEMGRRGFLIEMGDGMLCRLATEVVGGEPAMRKAGLEAVTSMLRSPPKGADTEGVAQVTLSAIEGVMAHVRHERYSRYVFEPEMFRKWNIDEGYYLPGMDLDEPARADEADQ